MKMNHLLVTNVEIGLEPWFFTISLWALGRRLSCSVFHLWNESRLVNTLMRLLHKARQAGSSMQSLRWCLEPRYVLCKCWQLFQSLCWFSAGEVCSCDLNLVFWKLTKIWTWQGSWQQTGAMPPALVGSFTQEASSCWPEVQFLSEENFGSRSAWPSWPTMSLWSHTPCVPGACLPFFVRG